MLSSSCEFPSLCMAMSPSCSATHSKPITAANEIQIKTSGLCYHNKFIQRIVWLSFGQCSNLRTHIAAKSIIYLYPPTHRVQFPSAIPGSSWLKNPGPYPGARTVGMWNYFIEKTSTNRRYQQTETQKQREEAEGGGQVLASRTFDQKKKTKTEVQERCKLEEVIRDANRINKLRCKQSKSFLWKYSFIPTWQRLSIWTFIDFIALFTSAPVVAFPLTFQTFFTLPATWSFSISRRMITLAPSGL